MTEEQFAQVISALRQIGRPGIADAPFAGLPEGIQLEPWASSQVITGFGTTPLSDISLNWKMTNKDVIVTSLYIHQYLTVNGTSTTLPLGVILPNAGIFGDGANMVSGLGFQFKLKSDFCGERDFNSGWLLSGAMHGRLYDRLPLGLGMDQSNSILTLTLQTLVAKGAGDTYAAYATLEGYYLRNTLGKKSGKVLGSG